MFISTSNHFLSRKCVKSRCRSSCPQLKKFHNGACPGCLAIPNPPSSKVKLEVDSVAKVKNRENFLFFSEYEKNGFLPELSCFNVVNAVEMCVKHLSS